MGDGYTGAMQLRDLFAFLIGRRQAIINIAVSRAAIPIGALLVLSAGLARDYDRADLLSEPWRLAIPFAASLAISWLLWNTLWRSARKHSATPIPFWRGYRGFLAIYWATAPLAWLYAIPWERWLSPLDAVRANLVTLGVVSIWRVALMCRAVAVLTGCGAPVAISLVLAVSCVATFVVSATSPVPPLALMGGIQPPDDQVLLADAATVGWLSSCAAFPILLSAATLLHIQRKIWAFPHMEIQPPTGTRGSWTFAAVSVAAWIPILFFTQPQQHNRGLVERAVRAQDYAAAAQVFVGRSRADFPAGWRPPPWIFVDRRAEGCVAMLDECYRLAAPNWIRDEYTDLALLHITEHGEWHRRGFFWGVQRDSTDFWPAVVRIARQDARFRDALRATCAGIATGMDAETFRELREVCGLTESQPATTQP